MIEKIDISNRLEDRLIDLAVRIIRLSGCLPRTVQARHLANQILRSGTSAAPNYAEARGAESRSDFVHKLRIVQKELNETTVWLRIIARAGLSPQVRRSPRMRIENRELNIDQISLSVPRRLARRREGIR